MQTSFQETTRLNVAWVILLLAVCCPDSFAQRASPQQLVQQQIDGWNNHDAVAFAAPYADTTTLYTYPDKVLARFRTHKEIEDYYASIFKANPNLHCDVANQMMVGNTVILHEKISGWVNRSNSESLVIYHIEGEKIVRVDFVRR